MKRPKSPTLYGLIEPGNIDPLKRPVVHNKDGSYSTTRSMSFEEDGIQILVPTVAHDGSYMTPKQAIEYYHKTGEHLGKFDTPANADKSAVNIHNYQAQFYTPDGKVRNDVEGGGATDTLQNNREKPFTDLYPKWDTPSFNPQQYYLRPKSRSEAPGANIMTRLYSSVLESFSDARQKLLKEQIDLMEKPNAPQPQRPQVLGENG